LSASVTAGLTNELPSLANDRSADPDSPILSGVIDAIASAFIAAHRYQSSSRKGAFDAE
jgi:hypothetical protein